MRRPCAINARTMPLVSSASRTRLFCVAPRTDLGTSQTLFGGEPCRENSSVGARCNLPTRGLLLVSRGRIRGDPRPTPPELQAPPERKVWGRFRDTWCAGARRSRPILDALSSAWFVPKKKRSWEGLGGTRRGCSPCMPRWRPCQCIGKGEDLIHRLLHLCVA